MKGNYQRRTERVEKYTDLSLDKIETAKAGMPIYANSKKGLVFKTNGGLLDILEIQGENAKRMPVCMRAKRSLPGRTSSLTACSL